MIGIVVVFALFEVFTIAANLVLTAGQMSGNSTDVLNVLGQAVWHGTGGEFHRARGGPFDECDP